MDTVFFQAIGESDPVLSNESGGLGKPRGPVDPKSEVVIKRKINPEMMKIIINFFLEIFIALCSAGRIRTYDQSLNRRPLYH